jgi:cysteine-rich repeat protein
MRHPQSVLAILGATALLVLPAQTDAQTCGNGVLESGEECDDGNTNGGEGCEADCTLSSFKIDDADCYAYSDTRLLPDGRQPVFSFQDISGTGTMLPLADNEVSGAIPIGFDFGYYGTRYKELYVSSNGFLTFLPGQDDGCCFGDFIPDERQANGAVYGFWKDLDPSAGGAVYHQTVGASPDRRFILQFDQVGGVTGSPTTWEIILRESTHDIVMQFVTAEAGFTDAAVGIENQSGFIGREWMGGFSISIENTAVRFYPRPGLLEDADGNGIPNCLECPHGICEEGGQLFPECDPCVETLCQPGNDPFCCSTSWDEVCVEEVLQFCGISDCSCGDGNRAEGVELCDDGNSEDGDGCDSDCTLSDFRTDALGCYAYADTLLPPDGTAPDFFFTSFVPITGTQVVLGNDEVSGPIPIGFDFSYYGTTYDQVFIASNGFLSFLPGQDAGCCAGPPIPSTSGPNGVVAALWMDLNPMAAGGIFYETLRDPPEREFIVEFSNVGESPDGSNPSRFQIVLHEDTQVIEVHYLNAQGGVLQTVAGIENQDGSLGVEWKSGVGTSFDLTTVAVQYFAINQDDDSDGVVNCLDNCPTVKNAAHTTPTDCNGDTDTSDPGEGAGEQCDQDGDGVGDACDNCRAIANARTVPAPDHHRTTGGQPDDDLDGFGNHCDIDFTEGNGDFFGNVTDLVRFLFAFGKLVTDSLCPDPDNNPTGSCARYDLNVKDSVINVTDLLVVISPELFGKYSSSQGCAADDDGTVQCPLSCQSGAGAASCGGP